MGRERVVGGMRDLRRGRAVVVVTWAVLCAAACEDAVPVADAAVGAALAMVDAAQAPLDATPAEGGVDAGTADAAVAPAVHGVPCGAILCFNEANQYCHTDDWGKSGVCEMSASPEPSYFACDGPEDCQSGACCMLAGASVCGLFGFCVAGNVVGEFMCHTDVECGQASRCCQISSLGPYRSCVDGLGTSDPCPAPK